MPVTARVGDRWVPQLSSKRLGLVADGKIKYETLLHQRSVSRKVAVPDGGSPAMRPPP